MATRARRVGSTLAGGTLVLGAGGGAAVVAGTLLATPAGAVTIEVINENDSGPGSLRHAIDNSSAGDVITFASNVHTISPSTRFEILHSLTIVGPGSSSLTIDGSGITRDKVFYVYDPAVILDVHMSGLTVANGPNAAIVSWGESLTLDDVHIQGNGSDPTNEDAAVLWIGPYSGGGGDLTIQDSVFSGNAGSRGGALTIEVTDNNRATVTGSVFVGNSVHDPIGGTGYGSAIAISAQSQVTPGQVTISDTVIHGNHTDSLGGEAFAVTVEASVGQTAGHAEIIFDRVAIFDNDLGGVLDRADGVHTFENTTIADNRGVGVAATPIGTAQHLVFAHSTITGNASWALVTNSNRPMIDLDHALIAHNRNGGFQLYDAARINSARFSLVQSFYMGPLPGNTNIVNVDPVLSPLTNVNGTYVVPFTSDSVVFNAGDPAFSPPPAIDQVGAPRVSFGRIDIGAYELQDQSPTTTTTTSTTSPTHPVTPTFTG